MLTLRPEKDLTAKKRDRHLTANTGNEATQVYEAGAYGAPHATDLDTAGIRSQQMRIAPRSALQVFMRKVASTDAREGRPRGRSVELESRDTYFFFGAAFLVLFFTVFLAFGAEALAARFAFAMMTRLVSVRRYQNSTWETVRWSNGTVCGRIVPSRQL